MTIERAVPTGMRISSTSVRVRYPETDRMGVVHHTHFLSWFEIGRTEWMREAGCSYAELERGGISMPVIEAGCRYLSPARYDDVVAVEARLEEVTRVIVRFTYRVVRQPDGKLLATGFTRHAAIDSMGIPRRLPPEMVSLFSSGRGA